MPKTNGNGSKNGNYQPLVGDNIRFRYLRPGGFMRDSYDVELTGFVHRVTPDSLEIANYSPVKGVPAFRDRVKRTYERDKIIITPPKPNQS